MKLHQVVDELIEERGLARETLDAIIREAMLTAYQRKYPNYTLKVESSVDSDDGVQVFVEKKVVAHVEDKDLEISVRRARSFDEAIEAGSTVWIPFDEKIGRVDVLRARRVIADGIRQIEINAIRDKFKKKEGTIVYGVVHKCERGGTVVMLQDTPAFLPRSLTSPNDSCGVGHSIRALLKEVLSEPRGDNQLILDRASDLFLQRLFEIEIPEVFEKLVEIKSIVRVPGYKSKVAVVSNDSNIDPVGTCVGVGGVRIKPILKELGGEKIDIVLWEESLESFVASALKPAQINRVQVVDEGNVRVWLDDDQRSLAIGKAGQNISLASRLTGVSIDLVQDASSAPELSFDEQGDEAMSGVDGQLEVNE